MVAAGLAATWATLAQVPLLSSDFTRERQGLFLTTAVMAYVLKDRIKEWTRQMLASRILRWDHDRHIIGDALSMVGFGSFSGRARERVRLSARSAGAAGDYRAAAGASHRARRDLGVRTDPSLSPAAGARGGALAGASWLCGARSAAAVAGGSADAARRSCLAGSILRLSDGRFRTVEIPQVYHLNVLLVAFDHTTGQKTLSRTRVVSTRKGILRLDHLGD
jgi:hypothetical protein